MMEEGGECLWRVIFRRKWRRFRSQSTIVCCLMNDPGDRREIDGRTARNLGPLRMFYLQVFDWIRNVRPYLQMKILGVNWSNSGQERRRYSYYCYLDCLHCLECCYYWRSWVAVLKGYGWIVDFNRFKFLKAEWIWEVRIESNRMVVLLIVVLSWGVHWYWDWLGGFIVRTGATLYWSNSK